MGRKRDPAEYIPWIGMAIAGISAIVTAVTKFILAKEQLEVQREQAAAAKRYWQSQHRKPPQPPS